ncbi:MAG: DUF1385 domain-containing protein [Desulfotomaculaceae bacterium]|nr:DUF1385 domain-containing protein [Desulfotomaculaceae bacterium]MDD4767038.1 DUF1385 domain-containing protein [Desulfotomaculaceae bacterium]
MGSSFQYGGQAVIEGVMMRGPDSRAIAVRKPDQSILVDEKAVGSITKRVPFLKWPFVRGTIVLIESLVMGIESLSFSASHATDDEEEQLTTKEIVITIILSLGLAILLFAVLPTAAAHLLITIAPGTLVQNFIEGFFRIAVLLIYVVAIGRLADIKRVFQYHGAEHKVINAYEARDQLVVEKIQRYSTLHPRCGTSFLLIVIVISIFIFSLLGQQVLWWRILSRVLLLPVVAGISYELVKLSGKYATAPLCRILIAPGMWLQKLTTNPPDDGQVEVALSAFKAVLKEGN